MSQQSRDEHDPGDEDDSERRRVHGYHEFVMGIAGCRVCGEPDPRPPHLVDPFRRLAERLTVDRIALAAARGAQ